MYFKLEPAFLEELTVFVTSDEGKKAFETGEFSVDLLVHQLLYSKEWYGDIQLILEALNSLSSEINQKPCYNFDYTYFLLVCKTAFGISKNQVLFKHSVKQNELLLNFIYYILESENLKKIFKIEDIIDAVILDGESLYHQFNVEPKYVGLSGFM